MSFSCPTNSIYNSRELKVIPNRIMQYWDGDISEAHRPVIDSWKIFNPEYEYEIYGRDSAAKYIALNFDSTVLRAFLMAKLPAMASDIFRVAWCVNSGGIYIDAASECLSPICTWFPLSQNLVLMRKWHGRVCNGVIGAQPNSSVLKSILNTIVRNVTKKSGNSVWEVTGPGAWKYHLDGSSEYGVIEQTEILQHFKLASYVGHKGETHWSVLQKQHSIFNDQEDVNSLMSIIIPEDL